MVHVRALPGTPRNRSTLEEIVATAVDEARMLREGGFDALLVENMHDLPYLKRAVGPEVTSAMTAVTREVVKAVDCPVGVQVLAGANREALAVALAGGAAFIRAEGLIFAHVADEGIMEADAGELLRFRRNVGAEGIKIFADIKKKHSSHAITADIDLAQTAHAAEFFGLDGLVVTGTATGEPTRLRDLEDAGRGTTLPVLVGSGTTPETLAECWRATDGFIVGSWIKEDGLWDHPLSLPRIRELMAAAGRMGKT